MFDTREPGPGGNGAAAQAGPVNVLFLIKHMDFGGGEYVFRTIIERLDRSRFRPVLVCTTVEGRYGRELRARGVPVYQGLAKSKLSFVLPRLRRIIKQERIQAIYLMDYRDAMLWGAIAGKVCGVPTILATHSTDWWGPMRSVTMIGKKLLNWHARIVTIAAFQRRHLIEHENARGALIEVVPNGIDLGRYSGAAVPRAQALPELPARGVVIGTVAVLRIEKNLGMLFEAVRRLVGRGYDIQVAIVGDGDMRQAMVDLVGSLGLAGRVHFLGFRDNPAALLGAFDIFTLTSVVEVMPITILEAMASGVPVVATAVGAVPEIVESGETGYVIPSRDVDALTERLADLCDSPDKRRSMGQRGRARVAALYTLDAMIARTGELLLNVIASRSR